MVSPGIWVRWRHERPPLDTVIEAKFDHSPDRIMTGTRCKRGCCLDLVEGYDVIAPEWWRIPEQPSRT